MRKTDVPPAVVHVQDQMTWGRWYWPVFLGVLLLAFLGPEIYALVSKQRNTLSDWVWVRLNIVSGETMHMWSATDYLFFGEWVTLITWLTWHFFFRRFT